MSFVRASSLAAPCGGKEQRAERGSKGSANRTLCQRKFKFSLAELRCRLPCTQSKVVQIEGCVSMKIQIFFGRAEMPPTLYIVKGSANRTLCVYSKCTL